MTSKPNIPSTPVKDDSLSSRTSIAIKWSMVADNVGSAGGRVLGYRVYMGIGVSSQFVRVLDAKDIRTMTSFIADDL